MSALACPSIRDVCVTCGIPADSECFDASGFAPLPDRGREVLLARFELRHQYCGVLEFFCQFTDEIFHNPASVETPGLEWLLLVNRRPLYPYTPFQAILNPWGFAPCPVRLRLPEAARVEFVVRRQIDGPDLQITRIGGRISGRYWFNPQ